MTASTVPTWDRSLPFAATGFILENANADATRGLGFTFKSCSYGSEANAKGNNFFYP